MSDFPMHGYLYDAQGMHGPPTVLANTEELWSFIGIYGNVALQDGLEFLVCSGDDEVCYLHIKDRAVLYGSGVEPQAFEQALANYKRLYLPALEEKSP
jgi:hypothetical protein